MPKYSYIVKNALSQTQRGIMDGVSREEVIKKLQSQGMTIIAVTSAQNVENAEAAVSKKFAHGGIKPEDLAQFAKQLSVLLSSGVTLLRALEISARQTSSRKFHEMLVDVTDAVKEGQSLTEALSRHPRTFTSMWTGLVDTGEASGNLAQVLEKLSSYLEMQLGFTRKITSAMVYPAVLLVAAGGAMFFFMAFIMPKFKEMFTQMNVELPVMTLAVFAISDFLKNNLILIIVGVMALGWAFRQWLHTDSGKRSFDYFSLNMPGLGVFFTTYYLERMASTLAILFESGVPIVYALDVAIRGVGNYIIEDKLQTIKENVKSGNALASEFQATGFFPPMVVEMASIGEEVGKLPEMFKKISQHYKTELETGVERFTAAFEPIMICVMGALVGVLVIALFMPMFKMSSM
jgi:type IV pilus assembly protein PilC